MRKGGCDACLMVRGRIVFRWQYCAVAFVGRRWGMDCILFVILNSVSNLFTGVSTEFL